MNQTPEEKLRSIAMAGNVSMRDIYNIVNQCYINEENFAKRKFALEQQQFQQKQLSLMDIQLHNEAMKEMLLKRKLEKMIWRMGKWESLKKLFIYGRNKRAGKNQKNPEK